jgi:hypothetical protein
MTPYEKGFEDCKKQVKAAMVAAVENAILMEREACARLCENADTPDGWSAASLANAIRARWQK